MTDPRIPDLDPRLRAGIDALPDAIEPGRDLWPELRARLDAERVRPIGDAPALTRRPWLRRAAAVVVLVGGTAAVTTYVVRDRGPRVVVVERTPVSLANDGFTAYERSAEDLVRALEQRRDKLDPATVEAIERSLRTIDAALAEARTALEKDPSSAQVRAYVETAYRQKIDFLRRANDVAATWTL